jgi:hypothetical protein
LAARTVRFKAAKNPVDPSPVDDENDIEMRISKSENVILLCQKEVVNVMLCFYNTHFINYTKYFG